MNEYGAAVESAEAFEEAVAKLQTVLWETDPETIRADLRELAATTGRPAVDLADELYDKATVQKDPRGSAAVLRAQAKFLVRKAGQMDQRERAESGMPPRAVLRAVGSTHKNGRKGSKARARIAREAKRRFGRG